MTTIAIDGNTISADGRTTEGDFVAQSDKVKIHKLGGVIYGYAGSVPDGEHLVDVVLNGADLQMKEAHGNLITICDSVVQCHTIQDGKLSSWVATPPYAIGSGREVAIAAMDMGKSSRDAVKYAASRDVYTGGKIKTIKYKKG